MLTNKEIDLATKIQRLEGEISQLKRNAYADAEAIIMYLDRSEPNIEAAIRKAEYIVEATREGK